MPDYKELYFKLFCAVSDEIENLKKIQCELEEIIMESEDNWDAEESHKREC